MSRPFLIRRYASQPGLFRRFLKKLNPFSSSEQDPIESTPKYSLRRPLVVAPYIEHLILKSKATDDVDIARLIAKSSSMIIYAFLGVTALGTIGVDISPFIAGFGITGFTIGFALKEIVTNYLSGILLIIQKPFTKGSHLKIQGGGGGIEGIVQSIDIRYVHLKTENNGIIMIPSSIVYSNPLVVTKSVETPQADSTVVPK